MRAFGLAVDDFTHRHMGKDGKPGGQCIKVGNAKYPMHFGGWKYYFQIQKPDHTELAKYPIIELTSPKTYEPQRRYYHMDHQHQITLEQWRARLVLPALEATKAILL